MPEPKATPTEQNACICAQTVKVTTTSRCSKTGKKHNSVQPWVKGRRPFNLGMRYARITWGSTIDTDNVEEDRSNASSARRSFDSFYQHATTQKGVKAWAKEEARFLKKPEASLLTRTAFSLNWYYETPATDSRERKGTHERLHMMDVRRGWVLELVPGCRPFSPGSIINMAIAGATKPMRCLQYVALISALEESEHQHSTADLKVMKAKHENMSKGKMREWNSALKRKTDAAAAQVTEAVNVAANEATRGKPKRRGGKRGKPGKVHRMVHASPKPITGFIKTHKPAFRSANAKKAVWCVAEADLKTMDTADPSTPEAAKYQEWASECARSHALAKSPLKKGKIYLYKIDRSHSSVKAWHRGGGVCGKKGRQRPMYYSKTKVDLAHSVLTEVWQYERSQTNSKFERTTWNKE